jgi:hypothetical protein
VCSIGWWLRMGPMRGCAGWRRGISSSRFYTGNWPVRRGLREIESGLASHAHRLYHLGTRSVSRSTLADANANATRPSEAFGALFAHLVAQAGRGLRRKIGEAVHLIGSTGLRLSELSANLARRPPGLHR